ncbi:hypothetical protein GCM10022403_036850 [Streptomyces coacervatus]|uniref:Terpene synthase n=1 Tax=Streptomyces coacervatus TaxID=647381 RepID=A0ABP7HPT4_9ACTN|nr:hypothetical protein [Streptomyces coacervatus]MDF2270892.1 hypothetical protein [Streptomyces coacervatus]
MPHTRLPASCSGPLAELQLAPDVIHPHSDVIENDTHRWATEQALTTHNAAAFHHPRFPRLAARMFPDAPADRVSAYARWLVILFALDDRSEQSPPDPGAVHALYQEITAALTGHNREPHDPLARIVHDQWQQLSGRMSHAWKRRFVRHLARHGQALAWEAGLRNERRTPSLAAFMDLRPWSNGMFMWDLIETVHPHEVPTPVTHTLAWRHLTNCSNQITAWRNDLVSLPKEAAIDNHDNYVIVLAHALDCEHDKAAAVVEQQITHRVQELLESEHALREQSRHLPASGMRALTETTNTLRTLAAAHARWVIESGRYAGEADTSIIRQPGRRA